VSCLARGRHQGAQKSDQHRAWQLRLLDDGPFMKPWVVVSLIQTPREAGGCHSCPRCPTSSMRFSSPAPGTRGPSPGQRCCLIKMGRGPAKMQSGSGAPRRVQQAAESPRRHSLWLTHPRSFPRGSGKPSFCSKVWGPPQSALLRAYTHLFDFSRSSAREGGRDPVLRRPSITGCPPEPVIRAGQRAGTRWRA